ncbi:cupin domain-containing protein [Oceanithermus sp.]|uniref:Cupin domain-containing protein n=1 Tax=Oceanithermus profundus TaxID=187137 RepID=A0A7C5SQ39_9DEIN|nr:cupin domain-containing protein [Oceanithermus sp.]HHO58167.1 cupin domain-containing protein [Oceanithermus profundus]
MKRKDLEGSPHGELFPGARATAFGGRQTMINHVVLDHGVTVPEHSHPEEQITYVLSGRLAFQIEDEVCEVGAGEAVWIPGGATHAVRALEPSVVLDVFSPVRPDLLERFGG